MRVMIALVGEQPLPNFLPVRFSKPEAVLFVYTTRTKHVYDRLRATLSGETQVYDLEVDPYDITTIAQKTPARLAELKLDSSDLLVNVTGGTKAMALAAFQVAQQCAAPLLYLESEGKQSYLYRYTWLNGELQHESKIQLPTCVTLDDLLDIYCGSKQWTVEGPNRREGGPFEVAVAKALRPRVDELYIGVKAFGGQVDLDVAVRLDNQIGIIEAKSGMGGGKMDGIKQLNTAGQQLGTYVKRFFTITVPPSLSQREIVNVSRICVVSLKEYHSGEETLSSSDAQLLVEAIEKELKGVRYAVR